MTGLWRGVALAVVFTCVCLWGSATVDAIGAKVRERPVRKYPKAKPTAQPKPADQIPDTPPIDIEKLWGKWYLLNLASKCPHQLRRGGSPAESTFITFTAPDDPASSPVSVSTNTRFNHDCWEILQKYYPTETQGRYHLKGKSDSEPGTDISIMLVDGAYAFIRYKKGSLMTLKLYGRSTINMSEVMLTRFEQLAQEHGMSLAYMFPFPNFGHCGSVGKKNIIDCNPTC